MIQPNTPFNPQDLESIWSALLSHQPHLIRAAFETLSTEEQAAVLAHLKRMAEEPGWHDEQRASARAALAALQVNH